MQFAKIANGKVEKILAGSKLPEGYTVIPNDHQLQVGDSVKFFTRECKRMSAQEAEAAGIISIQENETAVWEDGQYVVKADYTDKKYWYKETGGLVRFKIGDKPDDNMTNIAPIDPNAVWSESLGWYIPLEIKARRVREERDKLLAECDYVMMPDYPLPDKSEWETYRQALRDITEQAGFPDEVVWPEKPEI